MDASGRILLIDDDTELAEMMALYFSAKGISLDSVASGTVGLEEALTEKYALVILDVMLPGMDGFAVLRQLRLRLDAPVIMLTARASEEDRINGLDSGADDYLVKPFWPNELLARVRAVLRRVGQRKESLPTELRLGPLEIVPFGRGVRCDGAAVKLTSTEFEILEYLARSAGRIVSRKELMSVLHQCELAPYDRALDVHISHLRKKLGKHGAMIRTVRATGYLLELPAEAARV
jgi:DNA-binding response OmpR family regulator